MVQRLKIDITRKNSPATTEPTTPPASVRRAGPYKTRNGRLTIPAQRLRDLLKVVIIAYKPSLGASAAAFS
jgi:hypothetical protein